MSLGILDSEKLDAIGNAIRNKTGSTELYDVDEMPQAIESIKSEPVLQSKTVTYGANGTYTVDNDSEYDGLDIVEVTVQVNDAPELQAKTVSPSKDIQYVTPDSGYDGLSQVTVQPCSGNIDIHTAGIYNIVGKAKATVQDTNLTPSNVRYGVNIFGCDGTYTGEGPNLQYDKVVKPSAETQYIVADSGYDGLAEVTVEGEIDLIPDNIANGITIFGVEGTYTSDATADASRIQKGYSAYVNGEKLDGNMYEFGEDLNDEKIMGSLESCGILLGPKATNNRGHDLSIDISTNTGGYLKPSTTYWYHLGYPVLLDNELKAENIKSGVEILGITGTYTDNIGTSHITITAHWDDVRIVYSVPDGNGGLTLVTSVGEYSSKGSNLYGPYYYEIDAAKNCPLTLDTGSNTVAASVESTGGSVSLWAFGKPANSNSGTLQEAYFYVDSGDSGTISFLTA